MGILAVALLACVLHGNLQVYNDLRVDIPFDAMIAKLHHLLPHITIPNLVAQSPELLCAKGILSFLRIQLQDGIQYCKV
jgi:hypothetical protein